MEVRVLFGKKSLPFTDILSFRRTAASKGFSLVEVVVALGIVSFSLVGILSMFPVALDTAKDSKSETRITLIANTIFSDLRYSQATNAMVLLQPITGPDDYVNPNFVSSSALSTFTNVYVAYDLEGRPYKGLTAAEFAEAYKDPKAGFMASISTNVSPQPGLVRMDVTIISPPQAAVKSNSRKTNFFTTYLPIQ